MLSSSGSSYYLDTRVAGEALLNHVVAYLASLPLQFTGKLFLILVMYDPELSSETILLFIVIA